MLLISQRSSDDDAKFVKKMWTHLALLKREHAIEFDKTGDHVDAAQLVLLFISPEFLEEYSLFFKTILAQRVIPIACRSVVLHGTPFAYLQFIADGKPLSQYRDLDDGCLEVAKAIRTVIFSEFAKEIEV